MFSDIIRQIIAQETKARMNNIKIYTKYKTIPQNKKKFNPRIVNGGRTKKCLIKVWLAFE